MADEQERPKSPGLTAEDVRSLLSYDPQTGELRWLCRRAGVKAGTLAGNLTKRGYRRVLVKYKEYAVHRIIWMHVHGRWPPDELDHCNGDKSDNRLCNLREATRAENMCNKPRYRNNQSGLKGVRASGNRWEARIRVRGDMFYLGSFETAQAAHAAYVEAAQKHHGQFARAS